MSRRRPNYPVRNVALGADCGHHHHTREKALLCMATLGWNPKVCLVEQFYEGDDRKASIHHKGWNRRGTREEEYREDDAHKGDRSI